MCLCVYACVVLKLSITAQSGPAILVIYMTLAMVLPRGDLCVWLRERATRGVSHMLLGVFLFRDEDVEGHLALDDETVGMMYDLRSQASARSKSVFKDAFNYVDGFMSLQYIISHHCNTPVLSTCPLHTNSGCGKERRILIGSW